MTIRLGLTGSIGMGKSTTAQIFAEQGCAIWDADAAVRKLYTGGVAVRPLGELFPSAIIDNSVDRKVLKAIIQSDPTALTKIEKIVHPLVHQDRADFAVHTSARIAVFDIPLLFENNLKPQFDAVACVTVTPEIQRERVLARGTMTEAEFNMILEKQIPNEDKCRMSDFIIPTDTHAAAEHAVTGVIDSLNGYRT